MVDLQIALVGAPVAAESKMGKEAAEETLLQMETGASQETVQQKAMVVEAVAMARWG